MSYYDEEHEEYDEEAFEADKLKSVKWARKLLNGEYGEWVVLDTETTGLSYNNEPIEIGIVSKYGSEIFNERIKPNTEIEQGAINIHGIHTEDLQEMPTLKDVYPQIKKVLENKLVVIYNDSFDKSSLFNAIKSNKLPRIKFKTHCAMEQYARYYGQWNSYYGNYTWQKLPDGDHSAIGDAKATHELIKEMAVYQPQSEPKPEAKMFPPVQVFLEWKFLFRIGIFVSKESNYYRWYRGKGIKAIKRLFSKYNKKQLVGWFDLNIKVYFPRLVLKKVVDNKVVENNLSTEIKNIIKNIYCNY